MQQAIELYETRLWRNLTIVVCFGLAGTFYIGLLAGASPIESLVAGAELLFGDAGLVLVNIGYALTIWVGLELLLSPETLVFTRLRVTKNTDRLDEQRVSGSDQQSCVVDPGFVETISYECENCGGENIAFGAAALWARRKKRRGLVDAYPLAVWNRGLQKFEVLDEQPGAEPPLCADCGCENYKTIIVRRRQGSTR